MNLKAQIRAQLLFRLAFLVMMMGSSAVLWAFYQEEPAKQVIQFCAAGLFFSALSGVIYLLSPASWLPVLVWTQVLWDLGAAAFLMQGADTLTSVAMVLFLVHIVFCSVVVGSRGAVVSSLISSILFAALAVDSHGAKELFSISTLPRFIFVLSAMLFLGGCLGYFARHRERMRRNLDQTASALKDLSSLHAAIINFSPSGIMSIDREGKVIIMNRMAELILRENLVSKSISTGPFAELFKTSDRTESMLMIEGEMRSVGHQRVELPENQGWVVIFQDLTEVRAMESRMKINDKLASVGQLAAGIAHEIRNPLASLSGSIQLLKAEMPHEESSDKLMEIVLRETDRLDNLLKNFLMYAKPSEVRPERLDLKRHCQEIIDLVRNRVVNSVGIRMNVPDTLHCQCDPTQLSQVIWNLLLNAIQASPVGAEVVFSATVRKMLDGNRIRFEVKDSGSGIPAKLREKIFDPFFTTKAEGTGLGLPLAYQIVKAHGGEMGLETEEGRGSLFWFELYQDGPRAESHVASSSAA